MVRIFAGWPTGATPPAWPVCSQDEFGFGAADLSRFQPAGDVCRVDFRCAARQDQKRFAVYLKYEAVGDGSDLTAQNGSCGCRRRNFLVEDPDGIRNAKRRERRLDRQDRLRDLFSNLGHPESRLPLLPTWASCFAALPVPAASVDLQRR